MANFDQDPTLFDASEIPDADPSNLAHHWGLGSDQAYPVEQYQLEAKLLNQSLAARDIPAGSAEAARLLHETGDARFDAFSLMSDRYAEPYAYVDALNDTEGNVEYIALAGLLISMPPVDDIGTIRDETFVQEQLAEKLLGPAPTQKATEHEDERRAPEVETEERLKLRRIQRKKLQTSLRDGANESRKHGTSEISNGIESVIRPRDRQ